MGKKMLKIDQMANHKCSNKRHYKSQSIKKKKTQVNIARKEALSSASDPPFI